MPAGHTTGKSALQSRSRLTLSLSLLLSLTTLGACSNIGFPGVYRINVEQGNIVDQEMVDQLKPQMTRRQVRFVLGTPIIEDTFNADRWDYVHVVRLGNENLSRSQLTVVFEGDVLVDVEGDLVGAAPLAHRHEDNVRTPRLREQHAHKRLDGREVHVAGH